MTSILFLFAAVILSVIGCTLFLLRHRKPTSLEHGIDSFSREMRALSPDQLPGPGRRRARGSTPPPRGANEQRR